MIDRVGVLLSAGALRLVTVGVNGIASRGLLTSDDAPFDLLGLSPPLVSPEVVARRT